MGKHCLLNYIRIMFSLSFVSSNVHLNDKFHSILDLSGMLLNYESTVVRITQCFPEQYTLYFVL